MFVEEGGDPGGVRRAERASGDLGGSGSGGASIISSRPGDRSGVRCWVSWFCKAAPTSPYHLYKVRSPRSLRQHTLHPPRRIPEQIEPF